MIKKPIKKVKLIPTGFNSASSCPNCNPCNCPVDKERCRAKINRHAFMNAYEFTDQALIEELIMRIKMGCIVIKRGVYKRPMDLKDPLEYVDIDYEEEKSSPVLGLRAYQFEDDCRRDLARGLKKDKKTGKIVEDEKFKGNYTLVLDKLLEIQHEYRKLEDENKLCNICLYKPLGGKSGVPSIFCEDCWEIEVNRIEQREQKKKLVGKIAKAVNRPICFKCRISIKKNPVARKLRYGTYFWHQECFGKKNKLDKSK
jgi:hypothetical protein